MLIKRCKQGLVTFYELLTARAGKFYNVYLCQKYLQWINDWLNLNGC